MASAAELSSGAETCWRNLRKANPLVMAMTNRVTPQRVADVLLASGASPAMIDNPDEVPEFADMATAIGGAIYVNTGLHATQVSAADALTAWRGSRDKTAPVVVDPVGYGATPWRSSRIEEIIAGVKPLVVKGNASEILGLSGVGAADGKGVDAGSTQPLQCVEAARALAKRLDCVVAVSGSTDIVVGPCGTAVAIKDGNGGEGDRGKMLTRVTGTGCALGALVAAACAPASGAEPLVGAVAAHCAFTLAGRRAVARARGPGELSTLLQDELYLLEPEHLAEVEIEVL